MKLSISISENAPLGTPFVLKKPWKESIALAKQIGYDAVELHIRDPKTVDKDAIYQALEQNKIPVSSIGTGLGFGLDGLSLSHPCEAIRQKAIERIKDHIDFARTVNACVIIGTMKGLAKEHTSYDAFINTFKSSLQTLIPYAQKNNVILVLEAINRYESDALNTVEAMGSFIESLKSPYVMLHVDVFHMNIEEKNMMDAMIHHRLMIGHIHVADNNRHYPGAGVLCFENLITLLKDMNYQGYLAIESLDLPDPKTAAIEGYKHLSLYVHGRKKRV